MSKKKIIIIGAGQLGCVVSNIIDKKKYKICGFLDNDKLKIGKKINDIQVLGTDQYLFKLSPKNFNLVLCLGKVKSRINFLKQFSKSLFNFPVIVDNKFRKFKNVNIGKGSIILNSATILNNTNVGSFCLIGTNSTILHDVKINDNCIIGGGTTIGANVTLKKNVFIGVGSVIASKKITIKENCYICSGSVILEDLPKKSKVIGNPAKIIPYHNN